MVGGTTDLVLKIDNGQCTRQYEREDDLEGYTRTTKFENDHSPISENPPNPEEKPRRQFVNV